MPRRLTRWALFLSSYSPLFLIFAARHWTTDRPFALVTLALALVGVAGLLAYWTQVRRIAPHFVTVAAVESRTGDAMAYIVTYVIPFLSLDVNSRGDQVALTIFFLALGVLYVRSNLIHMNPLLNLRYTIHIVDLDGGPDGQVLLTRGDAVRPGARLRVSSLGQCLLLEKANAS